MVFISNLKDTFIKIFAPELFFSNSNKGNHSSTGDWLSKFQSIQTTKYFSVLKTLQRKFKHVDI